MGEVTQGADARSFEALSLLAAALLRPSALYAGQSFDYPPLSWEQFEALHAQASFRAPLERFLYNQRIGDRFTISPEQVRRLSDTPTGRLLILMLTEPEDEVERAALLVSGAVLYRPVLQTTAKLQRERLRLAMGAEAFQVATLEASMLYPSLCAYASDELLALILSQEQDAARSALVDFGLALLAAATSSVSKPLARLALERSPVNTTAKRLKRFSSNDVQLVIRLLQRRMSPWVAFIA